jgi:hypothetical protein
MTASVPIRVLFKSPLTLRAGPYMTMPSRGQLRTGPDQLSAGWRGTTHNFAIVSSGDVVAQAENGRRISTILPQLDPKASSVLRALSDAAAFSLRQLLVIRSILMS